MADLVRYTHYVPGVTETFGPSGVTMPIPGAAPALGNSIILTIRNSYAPGDINPISVSDNQGNVYSLDLEALGRTEGLHGVFRRHNITNAPTELVFTWAGGGSRYITINIGEWSGLANAAPIAAHNRIVTDTTGAISTTLPNVPANSCILAFLGHGLFNITGIGSDFTRTPTGAVLNSLVYDLDTGAAGNKVVGYTGEANDTGAIFALAYANAISGVSGSGAVSLPLFGASGAGTAGAGPSSVTLAGPLATAGQRLRTMPDLAPGDIVEYEVFAGTGTITVNTNGSFVASAGVTHFRYRVNDGGGFGDWVVDEVRAQRVRPATIIRLPGFGASGSGTVS